MEYKLFTDVSENGLITQRLVYDKIQEISKWICDTREDNIIQTFISLGWTPPNPLFTERSVMKTKKELLEYYGKCCVSEYALSENRIYTNDKEGEQLKEKDTLKLECISGQKKAIEFIFG